MWMCTTLVAIFFFFYRYGIRQLVDDNSWCMCVRNNEATCCQSNWSKLVQTGMNVGSRVQFDMLMIFLAMFVNVWPRKTHNNDWTIEITSRVHHHMPLSLTSWHARYNRAPWKISNYTPTRSSLAMDRLLGRTIRFLTTIVLPCRIHFNKHAISAAPE